MRFYSTNKKTKKASLPEVLSLGLAPDGGLFMPEKWPKLSPQFFKSLAETTFADIAFAVGSLFVPMPKGELGKIIHDSFTFPVPLKKLDDNLFVLELFHGPTMAFKDFGARFLSRTLGYFLKKEKGSQGILNIIVATSGDTGSAVASGFFKVPGIRVFILYPSGKVSRLQEQQLTTYGHNIVAVEVEGTFDDCQKLVKQVLSDTALKNSMRFSSANSINFGRLLPQSFYYFWACAQLQKKGITDTPIFVVPSGNFGNLFAGLMAKRLGLSVHQFVAATNANDIIPKYLKNGTYVAKKSKKTISNAMDVGNPSNFARMLALYPNRAVMAKDIIGVSVSDSETKKTIKDVFEKTGYLCDPHTAVGIFAARKVQDKYPGRPIVVLSTAHPAKFREVVEPVIGKKVPLPRQLQGPMKKEKQSHVIPASFESLKKLLVKFD